MNLEIDDVHSKKVDNVSCILYYLYTNILLNHFIYCS